jgi:2-phosphosulfolactate phosphatase
VNLRLHLVPRPTLSAVLLVDVWQGSLIGHLLQGGATQVWVVGSPRLGVLLAQPDDLLLGEQEGLPPKGFTHLASLTDLLDVDVAGKRIILLAPELVGCLEALQPQPQQTILLGYFRNARAVTQVLQPQTDLTLLPLGNLTEPSLGNLLAAGFLARRLLSQSTANHSEGITLATSLLRAFPDPQEALFQSDWGQQLYRMGRTEDIAYSSLISLEAAVPRWTGQQSFAADTYRLSRTQTAYSFGLKENHAAA